jgi:glucosamine--fructose-6-phosphate aminotransferase (isomerizing)
MEKEIREEPDVLEKILESNIGIIERIKNYLRDKEISSVYISARGTSDNASNLGKYLIESMLGLPTALGAPSLFTIYRTPPVLRNTLMIGVSQSGKGEDVKEVIIEGKKQGAFCIAITNDIESPIAQAADEILPCWAGEEKSVAATKTYMAEIFNLYLFGAILRDKKEILTSLYNIPRYVDKIITETSKVSVERYHFMDRCIIIGRGFNYPTAMEFSLKLKETSYIFSESFSSADFLHGPLALAQSDLPIFVFIPSGPTYSHLSELIGVLSEKHTEIIAFSFDNIRNARISLIIPNRIEEILTPLVFAPSFQMFANNLAIEKGYDPDHPRYLKKVTVTK